MTGLTKVCRSVGMGLVLGLAISATAQLGDAPNAVARVNDTSPADANFGNSHRADGHGGHVDTLTFSLEYPQDSRVTVMDGDDIEIVSEVASNSAVGDPTMEIHTRAVLLREDPADVVSQYIEQLLAEDALVLLYRTVRVDGQSAFRLWLGEQPDPRTGELKNSLVTFVGYGNAETAQITSYYSEDEAETAVIALHDSFTHLAPPDVAPE
ncbi:MAG: hypothetical protein AAFU71_05800 [Cyanobacteria bacterium J06632_22]